MVSPTAQTVRANIYFAEKDLALREDVHRLRKACRQRYLMQRFTEISNT